MIGWLLMALLVIRWVWRNRGPEERVCPSCVGVMRLTSWYCAHGMASGRFECPDCGHGEAW